MVIAEVVAGVTTNLKTGGSFGTTWDEIKLVASGSNVTVYLDDVITHATATTTLLTGNGAGPESPVPYYRVNTFSVYAG